MASHHHGKPLRDQMMLTANHLRRPSNMLLKDYLRDDLSSCSSSGFKSFPRRQCCTTVRFHLLEKDLQAKRNRLLRPTRISHRSSCSFKVASSTISALHKASRAVINAVKLLPFPSISATPSSSSSYRKNNSMKRLLSKSLSRKMLSRSFWRKAIEEEESEPPARWKSFRELLEEKEKPSSDQHTQSSSLISSSTSGSSSTKSNGNSWRSSSEFTWEILRSTSDNSDIGVVSSESTVVQKSTAAKTTSEDFTEGCTLEKIMVIKLIMNIGLFNIFLKISDSLVEMFRRSDPLAILMEEEQLDPRLHEFHVWGK